jgi:hypothetical protein
MADLVSHDMPEQGRHEQVMPGSGIGDAWKEYVGGSDTTSTKSETHRSR